MLGSTRERNLLAFVDTTLSAMLPSVDVQERIVRPAAEQLQVIIVGAGLGGLGAAIGLLLAGHKVHILEAASKIAEVGAGIQILPNSSRVLRRWGLEERLVPKATCPATTQMLDWKGNEMSQMDFGTAVREYGSPFWDFHRADLHQALLERAVELGATIQVNSRVEDVHCGEHTATVILKNEQILAADLVVGADGIFSRCRDILVGKHDPPIATGDLAYRVLLNTDRMKQDPELALLLAEPHRVRYWLGPDAHAVNYPLRHGELCNLVLLVPDDMPAEATTLDGNVEEMRALYRDWDPQITKMLAFCESVQKWKLCYRPGLDRAWSHSSGTFTLLGDSVHATLPYLASGAGMCLEDAMTLGLCFRKVGSSARDKRLALAMYEKCRRGRTVNIVERGNLQQVLYHLHDGKERDERDERFRTFAKLEAEVQQGLRDPKHDLPSGLSVGDDPFAWRRFGVGAWLLGFDCESDLESQWPSILESKF
ncbi:FAD/NAD(P)-binding domain-containing protein [Teratosphaeria nubilosa]|uniref:FAD/NAD(P)-binding domain-containing protein n=1 Tax=Teratosphaeria nubilosa TaxID=161662 RepID=A0A6G1L2S3_9PEZI|nr:FAD/NAD(P)-binding domain-containing protein [Teratosphaeria nubilosa]